MKTTQKALLIGIGVVLVSIAGIATFMGGGQEAGTSAGSTTATSVFTGFVSDETVVDENVVVQTAYDSYAQRQSALDALYLAEIATGDYTAEHPYIVVNPYEIAPQSAFIVFETAEAVSVTSAIQGRTAETTITNTISDKTTYHEIPLIGLYEGENTVTVTLSSGETYSYEITTQAIPESCLTQSGVELLDSDVSQLTEGLYMLKNVYRTLIDVNGDIRGYVYFGAESSGFGCSGADEVTENGHFFVTMDEYTTYSVIMELDYMGQVYREIQTNNMNTHHDAYLIDDSTLLLGQSSLDLDSYVETLYDPALEEIFNYAGGSVEVRNFGDEDALHLNTVAYGGEGYILVSLRGQHAVAKLSYPELEVQWVLSVYDDVYLGEGDVMLTPVGDDFEWFYSQHDVALVGENGDGTVDITLFDNGVQRGMDPDGDYPADEMYSRMVRYRIDEVNMTVEQVWDYGEELGNEYLAYVHSSTQYIPESNTYLGAFDAIDAIETGGADCPRVGSYVIEVTEDKEIVFQLRLNKYNYRVEKLSSDVFYSAWEGIGQAQRDYVYIGDPVALYDNSIALEEESLVYQISELSATQHYLNVSGWATIESALDSAVTSRQLVLTNQDSGDSYIYTMSASSWQVRIADVTEDISALLSNTAGFAEKRMNLDDLAAGDYRLTLIITIDEKNYACQLEQVVRIQ